MHRPLNRKRQIKLQSLWPAVLCFASVARCEATIADVPSYVDSQHEVLGRPPLQRLGGDAHVAEGQRQRRNHHGYKHPSTSKSRRVYAIRGGQQGYHDGEQTAFDNEYDRMRTSTKEPIGNLAASRNMKKFSSASSSTTDDVAEAVRTRGEGIAADLNLKQEPTQDETLRDHSSAAFGDPGGHTSYDPATAGMHVANRRSFFLGIRRIVLLVQMVELILACLWQTAFPYGGIAGFVAGRADFPAFAKEGDGRGRLGLAVSASLAQAALYTSLLIFFGCDRVVLRAVRWTGWEHGAAALWILLRACAPIGNLTHVLAGAWCAAMMSTCIYFGRQL